MVTKPQIKDFFALASLPYYAIYVLMLTGLGIATFIDVQVGITPIITLDLASLVFYIAVHILVMAKVIRRNTSVFLLSSVLMIDFWVSSFIITHMPVYHAHFEGNMFMMMLVAMLLITVMGLSAHRLVPVVILILNVAYMSSSAIINHNAFMLEQLPIIAILLTGCMLAVFFYRSALENMTIKLRDSFESLELQSHNFRVLKEKAEALIDVNHPFVVFGKSTSGLIHDLKNDVNLMSIRTQVLDMKFKRGRPMDEEDVIELSKAVKRIEERISMARFLAGASQERPFEIIPVHALLESAIYPFRISQTFRNRISFISPLEAPWQIFSSRYHLLRILENLIQNACEAIIDQAHAKGRMEGTAGMVQVDAQRSTNALTLAVQDDGPGIPVCNACTTDACLDCPHFSIGHTTKAYGSGYGMVNVMSAVKSIGASLNIVSKAEHGTTISITIPDRPIPPPGA